ncbi:MAG: ABC transporter ATP-binding protein [Bacteroidales bacterium]|nr:ABC transporter ATP-binding protein [Bacteroidales bacterium]
MSTAIEFNNVSKQYRLGLVSTKTLSHDLNRWWKMHILGKEDPYLKVGSVNDRSKAADSDFVWALKDINFKIEQGDVVGIIGKNGAGKSTMLKLLSRVTGPTTGTIRTKGRIGALLEVGTGFHSEMTGRENIYMNGAILGMTKKEISHKLDEIVDFSGCERYIDTPVKRYSSGMIVRLGFAVAAFLEPEILVVDEVLAVGDAEFQQKAIGKMQDVSSGEGRTVLFVSHNMESIRTLCHHGILLDKGSIAYTGDIESVVEKYLASAIADLTDYTEITKSHQLPYLTRKLEYLSVKMDNDVKNVSTEEPLRFTARFKRNDSRVTKCNFGVVIKDDMGRGVGAAYSEAVELNLNDEVGEVNIEIKNHQLAKGKYSLNFNICQFGYDSNDIDYDIVRDVISFQVTYVDAGHTKPFLNWAVSGKTAYQDIKVSVK